MTNKIENTETFKGLIPISQRLTIKRVNRIKIEEEIIIARNIGLEKWKKQTPLQQNWKAIVIEILNSEAT